MQPARPKREAVSITAYRLWQAHADILILAVLTIIAAALRLWQLEDYPPGLHGDEAITGLDGQRVQREGWIGPYVSSALGTPTGAYYWAAAALQLTGHGVSAVRMTMALLGIAAVPLTYLTARLMFDRRVGVLAAALTVPMAWYLLYSRTAFVGITWPFMELVALALLFAALKYGRILLYALAGLAIGLGVYTYNVYPLFAIVIAIFGLLVIAQGRERRKELLLKWGIAGAAAFVVALPLIRFAMDPESSYFHHHKQYSLLSSAPYRQEDLAGRIELLARNGRNWLAQMAWEKRPDFVDAAGTRPMLDWLTVGLFLVGLFHALRNMQQPANQLLLLMLLIIPIACVVSLGGGFRRSFGLAPVVAILAALPLAGLWHVADQNANRNRLALKGTVILVVVAFTYINLKTFEEIATSDIARLVYAEPLAEASKYLHEVPDRPYVYFLSACCTLNHETRQYLAPGYEGEDRSSQFGRRQDLEIDRTRSSVFLLLPGYLDRITEIERLYPGGRTVIERRGQATLYIAYHLPAVTVKR